MATDFNITSNVKQWQKSLSKLGKKQLPFAVANTINDVLFKDVKPQIQNTTFPKAFKTRAKNMARGVMRISKAKKNKLVGEYADVLGRTYLQDQHVDAKTKTPRTGKFIAVPVLKPGRRVSKRKRKGEHSPRSLLADRSRFFFGRAGRGVISKGDNQGGSGVLGIWERMKTGKLRMWYRMIPRAEYEHRLDFYKDANIVTLKNFQRRFEKQLLRAIKSAR